MHGAFSLAADLLAAAPPSGRARLSALLLILATLLVFVLGLLVILAVRRSLRPAPSAKKKVQAPAAPAWSEAGRRVAPIESAPEQPPDGATQ